MQLHNVIQGTQVWKDLRVEFQGRTASNAAAMMGEGLYTKRDKLIHQVATGETDPISPQQQERFDNGHAAEARVIPVIEKEIGFDLFSVTGSKGDLLASFDGVKDTMLTPAAEQLCVEVKLLSKATENIKTVDDIHPQYIWQMEQQMLVIGTNNALLVIADREGDSHWSIPYESQLRRRERLVAGWKQFDKDVAAYVPSPRKEKVIANLLEPLPVLFAEVSSEVKSSNLPAFQDKARAFLDNIKTDLVTEKDFADAEVVVKQCSEGEKICKALLDQLTNGSIDVAKLKQSAESLNAEFRSVRLGHAKKIKTEKESIKNRIISEASGKLQQLILAANENFGGEYLPYIKADFHAAAKNKRDLDSLQSAVNDELYRGKMEILEWTSSISSNLKIIAGLGKDYQFLFNDVEHLVLKEPTDLRLVTTDRKDRYEAQVVAEAEFSRVAAEAFSRSMAKAELPVASSNVTPLIPPIAQEVITIAQEVITAFTEIGFSEADAKRAEAAISNGLIPHVKISKDSWC